MCGRYCMDWLEFGKCFDWISPTLATVGDLVNGPGHTFLIPAYSGFSGREVDRLLKGAGVQTWGMMIPPFSDTLMVTVPKRQAAYAQAVLQRAMVPLLNEMPSKPEQVQPTSMGSVFDVFSF